MSSKITVAMVNQFSANVFHLSQQKGSRLSGSVRNEMQHAEFAFWERLGATNAVRKVSRHGDTPLVESDHSRRRVGLHDYEIADLIDTEDRIRTLIDPEGPYAQSFAYAMGRSKDDEIIDAALGTADTGKDGGTPVALPASQFIGAVQDGASPAALGDLDVKTLIKVKSLFGQNDVDEDIPLHIAVTQKQIDNLLRQTSITSSDYNTVKALVEGKVDYYMGFRFHRIQRLKTGGAGGSWCVQSSPIFWELPRYCRWRFCHPRCPPRQTQRQRGRDETHRRNRPAQ